MIRQSMGRGAPKKRRGNTRPTGSGKNNPVPEDLPEEIDPAEFFDPEEFAAGRRDAKQP